MMYVIDCTGASSMFMFLFIGQNKPHKLIKMNVHKLVALMQSIFRQPIQSCVISVKRS